MPPVILNWADISEDKIVFEEPRQNSHHGLSVPVKYLDETGNKTPICFQTPVMRLPFGISDRKGEYGRKIEANFSFQNYEPIIKDEEDIVPHFADPDMQAFYDWIVMWDKINVDAAVQNSQVWFRKKIGKEIIQELYKPNLKPSSQPDKYSPTVRAKIPTQKTDEEEPTAHFFDSQKNKLTLSKISRGSKVIALIKVTGLWFAGKSFGMNYSITQLVDLGSDKFDGCAIDIPGFEHKKRDGNFVELLDTHTTKKPKLEIPVA